MNITRVSSKPSQIVQTHHVFFSSLALFHSSSGPWTEFSLLLARSQVLFLEESFKLVENRTNAERCRDRKNIHINPSPNSCMSDFLRPLSLLALGSVEHKRHKSIMFFSPFSSPFVKPCCPVDAQMHILCTHSGVPLAARLPTSVRPSLGLLR